MDILEFLISGEDKDNPLPKKETKTDVEGYYKTPTGAIVSKDEESLHAYKIRKAKNTQLNTMKKDIDSLKSDISEIKELLKGLVK